MVGITTAAPGGTKLQPNPETIAVPNWRDRKKYLWLLGAIVPVNVFISWCAVQVTGVAVFWWWGSIVAFGIVPVLDHLVGPDLDNPPDSALARLERDPFYRWATYLYLPIQYLSLLLACWLWSGGGWVEMSLIDDVGLMVTVGGIGGISISTAHELGHKRARAEQQLQRGQRLRADVLRTLLRRAQPRPPCARRHPARPGGLGTGRERLVSSFRDRSSGTGVRSAWNLESRRLTREMHRWWRWCLFAERRA